MVCALTLHQEQLFNISLASFIYNASSPEQFIDIDMVCVNVPYIVPLGSINGMVCNWPYVETKRKVLMLGHYLHMFLSQRTTTKLLL